MKTLKTLKVKNGTYTNMQFVRTENNANTYNATFKMCNGYTEQRVIHVKNNKVLAWQS